MIERLQVKIPAGAAEEFSSQESTLCALSLLVRILKECLIIHSSPVPFFPSFKVQNSSCTLIPLCMPGPVHSGSVCVCACVCVCVVCMHGVCVCVVCV